MREILTSKRRWLRLLALMLAPTAIALGQNTKSTPKELPGSTECVNCHDTGKRTGKREAGMPPAFDAAALRSSPHASLECANCHADVDPKKLPHAEKLAPVDCGSCHADESQQFAESLHGRAVKRGDPLAPSCKSCHGTHNIMRPSVQGSPTSTMQIPKLCGSCHKEGTPVQLTRNIPESNILSNYMDSIHGEGLFKRGLTVTAVCSSCHTAHSVLPHTDPRSSIAKQNIAKTCTKCHAQIETVHRKVIRGELWEKEANKIPACVDCHSPHQVRRVFYPQGMADRDCMSCHSNPDLKMVRGGKTVSLFVKQDDLEHSRHSQKACVQCHTGGTPSDTRPCRTITEKVDCSICHADQVAQYKGSTHGKLFAQGSPDAPACNDCHTPHKVLSRNDPNSATFSRNVPNLCASCHRSGQKAALRYRGTEEHIVESYRDSVHGKGLLESGLTVTANCADCHTAHGELPANDPQSSVNRANVAKTCAKCHRGIFDLFEASVHSPQVTHTDKKLPVCSECHTAHGIERTDRADFRLHIMDQCGRCHKEITESYFETFHGKVSKLGYTNTAKCYDCHGSHDILPVTDQRSHLSRANIVATCSKCHTGSHRQFAGYLTHATHHDPKRYPFLFYTFWGMTTLLIGTLTVSGAHTALWLHRSLGFKKNGHAEKEMYVRRFQTFHRNLHLTVISSFLGLALTGMILKFSYAPWAKVLARLLGGFEAAGLIHRFCAVATFTYFGFHIWDLLRKKRQSGRSWRHFIFGPQSMMLNGRDWKEFVASMKWFIGKGERPDYGRWTYWEKFDYFAVFWGVAVIGMTGLILWFPTIFTRVMPGWAVNVATTIHSDEALLAVCFIFSVHFFNTHFRPEKFPIDTVIFTGGMPLEEFKRDRPREYAEMLERGELEKNLMNAPIPLAEKMWRRIGFTALGIGLALIALILYAMIFSYQ
ncbi:MAG TPA: cytochrome c3 family protein [Bryobacteraceae bacterium]|nr:cytochrome c3 family protein [Bryobacteraceae bacterium]